MSGGVLRKQKTAEAADLPRLSEVIGGDLRNGSGERITRVVYSQFNGTFGGRGIEQRALTVGISAVHSVGLGAAAGRGDGRDRFF